MSASTTGKRPAALAPVHEWERFEGAPLAMSFRRLLENPVGRRHYVEIHVDPGVITVVTADGFVKRAAEDDVPFKTTEEARAFLDRLYA